MDIVWNTTIYDENAIVERVQNLIWTAMLIDQSNKCGAPSGF